MSTFPYICSVVFHQIGEYISIDLFYLYVLCLCKGWFLWIDLRKGVCMRRGLKCAFAYGRVYHS